MSSISQVSEQDTTIGTDFSMGGNLPTSSLLGVRRLPAAAHQGTLFLSKLMGAAAWVLKKIKTRHERKTLRMCESLPLGEKRFVAVIQVEGERFLIGCSSSSVSMLARLQESATFGETLERCTQPEKLS